MDMKLEVVVMPLSRSRTVTSACRLRGEMVSSVFSWT